MRIAVFGATGRTGRLVMSEARSRELDVTAFVRDRSSAPDLWRGVSVVVGSFEDLDTVAEALVGADAVISAMGPIAEVTTTEISTATQALVRSMERHGPRRLVLAANATVFTEDEITGPFANVAAEHRRDLAIVRASSLDWTMLAPAILRDDGATGEVAATIDGAAPGGSIARLDLARAMLDALVRPGWMGHAVGVAG